MRGFLDEAFAEVCRKAALSGVFMHGQLPPLSRLPCGSARKLRGQRFLGGFPSAWMLRGQGDALLYYHLLGDSKALLARKCRDVQKLVSRRGDRFSVQVNMRSIHALGSETGVACSAHSELCSRRIV